MQFGFIFLYFMLLFCKVYHGSIFFDVMDSYKQNALFHRKHRRVERGGKSRFGSAAEHRLS